MTSRQKKQAAATGNFTVETKTIRELKDKENFATYFFDEGFLKTIGKKDWERFDSTKIPEGMSEIVEIGHGKWKTPRTIDIDLSKSEDQLLLCFIVYFVRGITSASYKKNPLGYIVQTQEFKERVLGTTLNIKKPGGSSVPLF